MAMVATEQRAALSQDHDRILMAATLLGEGLSSYKANDVRIFMGRDAHGMTSTSIAQALRHLGNLGHIQQIGPGEYRKPMAGHA